MDMVGVTSCTPKDMALEVDTYRQAIQHQAELVALLDHQVIHQPGMGHQATHIQALLEAGVADHHIQVILGAEVVDHLVTPHLESQVAVVMDRQVVGLATAEADHHPEEPAVVEPAAAAPAASITSRSACLPPGGRVEPMNARPSAATRTAPTHGFGGAMSRLVHAASTASCIRRSSALRWPRRVPMPSAVGVFRGGVLR